MSQELNKLLETYLDASQIKDYDDAVGSLYQPIPYDRSNPNTRAFAAANIQFQDKLDQIKAQLAFIITRKKPSLYDLEHTLISDARGDGMKTKEERVSYCYSNSKYIAYKSEIDQMQILYERLTSLQWSLRNQLQILS